MVIQGLSPFLVLALPSLTYGCSGRQPEGENCRAELWASCFGRGTDLEMARIISARILLARPQLNDPSELSVRLRNVA